MGLKLLSIQWSLLYMSEKEMELSMKYSGLLVRMVAVETMLPDYEVKWTLVVV
jgi:hypothetical protein